MTDADAPASSESDPPTSGALAPLGHAARRAAASGAKPGGPSAADLHLLAQAERRRGLKAGPQAAETASSTYAKAEWSGEADRRRPVGGAARKRV
jgi:hypothetical protein